MIEPLTHTCLGFANRSSYDSSRDLLEETRATVNAYNQVLVTQLDDQRCIEARAEITFILHIRDSDFPLDDFNDCSSQSETNEDHWHPNVNHAMRVIFTNEDIQNTLTSTVRDVTFWLVVLVQQLLIFFSYFSLMTRLYSTFGNRSRLLEGFVPVFDSIEKTLAMVAWCEQTLNGTLVSGRWIGVPALTLRDTALKGWESPIAAIAVIQKQAAGDIYRFLTYSQCKILKTRPQTERRIKFRQLLYMFHVMESVLGQLNQEASPNDLLSRQQLILLMRILIVQLDFDCRMFIARRWCRSGTKSDSLPILAVRSEPELAAHGIKMSLVSADRKKRRSGSSIELTTILTRFFPSIELSPEETHEISYWPCQRLWFVLRMAFSICDSFVTCRFFATFCREAQDYGLRWGPSSLTTFGDPKTLQSVIDFRQAQLEPAGEPKLLPVC